MEILSTQGKNGFQPRASEAASAARADFPELSPRRVKERFRRKEGFGFLLPTDFTPGDAGQRDSAISRVGANFATRQ
jgi:hypothetical protein